MDKEPFVEKPGRDNARRRAALSGALWTLPVWLAVLLVILAVVFPQFEELLSSQQSILGGAAVVLFTAGSSLCFISGFALTPRPLGVADAAKTGAAASLAVAFSYFLFAFFAFFYGPDEKGHAWGAAFGLMSMTGSVLASSLGALARLAFQHLKKETFNPYKYESFPPKK